MQHKTGLGRAIKIRRTILGISRKDLAVRAEISYPFMAEIENGGKTPSLKTAARIAESLEWSAAELQAAAEEPVGVPVRGIAPEGEPTIADLMAEIKALRNMVEELVAART